MVKIQAENNIVKQGIWMYQRGIFKEQKCLFVIWIFFTLVCVILQLFCVYTVANENGTFETILREFDPVTFKIDQKLEQRLLNNIYNFSAAIVIVSNLVLIIIIDSATSLLGIYLVQDSYFVKMLLIL